jgi:Rrf2 family protein
MSYSLAFTQAIALMISIGAQNQIKQIEWVSAANLAELLSIPRPTVVNILTRLLASGLLESKEGNKGGVRLAKASADLTLLDIFEAIERKRPLFRTDMAVTNKSNEAREARRKVVESFQAAEDKMKQALAGVQLNSLFGC